MKGVDFILRAGHHPERGSSGFFETQIQSLWGGPRFHIASNSYVEWMTYFYGSQDRAIHRWIKNHVKPDWICFDIGMNFGFFTCLCAQLGQEAHGFEAIESLVERAKRNCSLNGFRNVSLNQVVLSDREGQALFNLPREGSSNRGTGSLVHGGQGDTMTVQTLTLDSYCRNQSIRRLDLMKIDVEGAEHQVLAGAVNTVERHRPVVIFEKNPESFEEAGRILTRRGYKLHDLNERPVGREFRNRRLITDILAMPA